MRPGVDIVSLAAVGGLAAHRMLAATAVDIFGPRRRSPGWMQQKLHRECVDPDMSVVAMDGDSPVGYVLVGTPPSRDPMARTAGVGVIETRTGRGVGTALLEAAAVSAHRRGREGIESLVAPEMASFYERAGFESLHPWETWQADGTGENGDATATDPAPWTTPETPVQLAAWLKETYERTHEGRRHCVKASAQGHDFVAHLTLEGEALVAHRLCVDQEDGAQASLLHLRGWAEEGAPLLVAGLTPDRALVQALNRAGYRRVQPAELMRRSLQ